MVWLDEWGQERNERVVEKGGEEEDMEMLENGRGYFRHFQKKITAGSGKKNILPIFAVTYNKLARLRWQITNWHTFGMANVQLFQSIT